MSTFISYLLTSGIILIALYLIYKWLLARETFFHFNRFYLLASYAVAFLTFPIVRIIKEFSAETIPAFTPEVETGPISVEFITESVEQNAPILPDWLIYAIGWIMVAGMAAMTIQTIIVAIHIIGTIRRGEHIKLDRYTLVLTENSRLAPFSWCGYIIMNREDYQSGREMILNHEMNHQRYLHWADLLVAQLAIILQWFNPAAWLMRDELRSVHEYEADMAVLLAGANAKEYQLLLIKKAVGAKFPALANCLNHSKLKKRITMMLKTKSSPWARMRAFVALPAIALAAAVINPQAVASALTPSDNGKVSENTPEKSNNAVEKTLDEMVVVSYGDAQPATSGEAKGQDPKLKIIIDGKEKSDDELKEVDPNTIESITINKQNDTIEVSTNNAAAASGEQTSPTTASDDEPAHKTAEEMPQFPGGDKGLLEYVMMHLKYPEEAMKNNIQGLVVAQFVVTSTGAIGEVKIVRSADPLLDQAAIDVIKSLPAFTPGKIGGNPVSVWYTIPVNFRLSSGSTAPAKAPTK